MKRKNEFIQNITERPPENLLLQHELTDEEPEQEGEENVNVNVEDYNVQPEETSKKEKRALFAFEKTDYLKVPARKQLNLDKTKVAYQEQGNDYNIWYGRQFSLNTYNEDSLRVPASTKIDLFYDPGYTKADFSQKNAREEYICLYFARGKCHFGSNCEYFHRLPNYEDEIRLGNMIDIFGRAKHRGFRDDMRGAGSFQDPCQTLYIGDLLINSVEETKDLLYDAFCHLGQIEVLRVIPSKAIAFIRFSLRVAAEFAKEAMDDQPLGPSGMLKVRWSAGDIPQ